MLPAAGGPFPGPVRVKAGRRSDLLEQFWPEMRAALVEASWETEWTEDLQISRVWSTLQDLSLGCVRSSFLWSTLADAVAVSCDVTEVNQK